MKEEFLWSGKNNLMFGEDGLEVLQNNGCLGGVNGMEFCNNAKITFFEEIFHAMGTDDLQGNRGDD
jgi:hypothetical protein